MVNNGGSPFLKVASEDGETQIVPPELVSSLVLGHLKGIAETYCGKPVTKAVITCPAYFNDSQRLATKHAASIAGLDVIGMINEPTAAALAYGFENKKDASVMVFDFGGGTLDVTVLTLEGECLEVLFCLVPMSFFVNFLLLLSSSSFFFVLLLFSSFFLLLHCS